MTNVLMIEDDYEIAEILIDYLARYNIKIKCYENPQLALSDLTINHYDLIILDLSLPEIDGLDVISLIRQKWDTPIIISSARSDISDKAACFSAGADDYLPKPYDSKELVLRIQSILRRYKKSMEPEKEKPKKFILDEAKMEIFKDEEELTLTNAEFEILAYLIKKNGYVISREELLNNIESIKYESSLKSINVIVGRIRQKIEEDPKSPQHIISIRGIGYKLVNE